MNDKLYTVAEANALLPHLAPALVELRDKYEAAVQARDEVAEAASGNGHNPATPSESAAMARVKELLERVTAWNIQLRDVDSGLVDFPTVIEGEAAWLCWRLGEPEVAFWHPKDQGFSARRPLANG